MEYEWCLVAMILFKNAVETKETTNGLYGGTADNAGNTSQARGKDRNRALHQRDKRKRRDSEASPVRPLGGDCDKKVALSGLRPSTGPPDLGFAANGCRVWVIERCKRCHVLFEHEVREDVSEQGCNDPHVDIQVGAWTVKIGKPF